MYSCIHSFINHFLSLLYAVLPPPQKKEKERDRAPSLCSSPIVAGLVDLGEKQMLRYIPLKEVCTECCENISEAEFISTEERTMDGMEIREIPLKKDLSKSLKR